MNSAPRRPLAGSTTLLVLAAALAARPIPTRAGTVAAAQADYLAAAAAEEKAENDSQGESDFTALAERARTSGPVSVADLPDAWRNGLRRGGGNARAWFGLQDMEARIDAVPDATRRANPQAFAHAQVDMFQLRHELSEMPGHLVTGLELVEHAKRDLANMRSDRDGDTIPDDLDKCPDQPGPPPDGCPAMPAAAPAVGDRDHDGIPDDVDKCPDLPETVNGILDSDGCPDDLRVINFATDSAALGGNALDALRWNYSVLDAAKDVRIRLEGHCDSTGTEAHDDALGVSRAHAVRDYLTTVMGLSPSRFEVLSYGHRKPIADNATSEGRAQNRRVEFVVLH